MKKNDKVDNKGQNSYKEIKIHWWEQIVFAQADSNLGAYQADGCWSEPG